jgi:mRNA-degrading endonuclease YafQ of YafQ-DinJ toxin-antitoxin module
MKRSATKEQVAKSVGDWYDELQKNPRIWRCSACEFKRVADVVDREIARDDAAPGPSFKKFPLLDNVYVYVMSVAIENTLKGILMVNNLPFEEITKNHDLVAYYNGCRKCGLSSGTEDVRLLKILTHSAQWAGRYNLPKKRRGLENAFKEHGLHFGYGVCVSPLLSRDAPSERGAIKAEREKIRTLYERLFAYFLEASRLTPCSEEDSVA